MTERDAIVRRFLDASGMDLDALLDLCTDDTVMELVARGLTIEGRDACRELLGGLYGAAEWKLRIIDLYEAPERDTVIAEYATTGRVIATDEGYETRHVGIFRFTGDRIAWSREYTIRLPAGSHVGEA
jgi:ketosteroid isomerase-like protein